MASFRVKIGWEKPRKSETKKKSFQLVPTRSRTLNSKKILKKVKKLKNTIIASFQAKIRWEGQRNREKKKYRSDEFLPDPENRIPKK